MAITKQNVQQLIQSFMIQLSLYQLKIMKNYCSKQKQAIKKLLAGKNINQNETLEALD